MDRRRADDHLSIVAGMTRTYTERLVEGGVPTRRALAVLPAVAPVAGMNRRPLGRLRDQARLQVTGEDEHKLIYELIEPDPEAIGHGLAALPEPSPLDLFFDIEADPWMGDAGLEYLLGIAWRTSAGGHEYRAIWGHDPAGEKAAFETFIDLVMERLERDPGMHVYHYAGYESGAIKRLMQRHATREDEVDRILRGEVLVDLYQVVRQGIRASVESYSIKKIEKFYMPAREGPVTEAGFSVVEYERWLRDHDERHLRDLADYNRDDCISTLLLRDWLEDRRREGILQRGWDLPRPVAATGDVAEALSEWQAATRAREERLRMDVPGRPGRTDHRNRRRDGCSPACSTGTVVTRSRAGGSSTGSGSCPWRTCSARVRHWLGSNMSGRCATRSNPPSIDTGSRRIRTPRSMSAMTAGSTRGRASLRVASSASIRSAGRSISNGARAAPSPTRPR